jgi:hypothetical protein
MLWMTADDAIEAIGLDLYVAADMLVPFAYSMCVLFLIFYLLNRIGSR